MVEKVLLMGASQQALCETLGYDEGKAYYLILTKDLEYGDTSQLLPLAEEVSKLLMAYYNSIIASDS